LAEPRRVLALGEELSAELWAQFEPVPPVGRRGTLRTLGIAHGWAGILYALLRWRVSVDQPSPPDLERRLRELADLAEPVGNGARWKVKWRNQDRSSTSDYMTGWCNGSAGYVFLWVLAHRVFGANEYLDLAEKAAWNAWERASDFDSLCCGLAGCGYALLALFRHTGERTWLERAREIAKRALSATIRSEMPDSLYKGTLGVALLAADIIEPQFASMPLFESEGWAEPR
jgi:hypothetical protein